MIIKKTYRFVSKLPISAFGATKVSDQCLNIAYRKYLHCWLTFLIALFLNVNGKRTLKNIYLRFVTCQSS